MKYIYIYILEKQEKGSSHLGFPDTNFSIQNGENMAQVHHTPAYLDHCKHMAVLLFWFPNLDLELKMKSCVLQ